MIINTHLNLLKKKKLCIKENFKYIYIYERLMMDDLPFRTRAIWDSDCGIVLLDGQHQVVSVIVRRSYSSMIEVQGICVVYAEGPRVPRDM